MATKKSGLGKGLDALFIENSVEEMSAGNTVKLNIIDIEPNKEQPRKVFNEEKLRELSESIMQHGVLQPLLVRPLSDGTYQLVAGERRWRASRMAGLTEVPVVIRELSDEDAMAIALIENLQREDLSAIEEAEGIRLLIDTFGMTQEEVSEKIGKSRSGVTNVLRLLKLPKVIQEYVNDNIISSGHARALLPLNDENKMIEFSNIIIKRELSVRDTEEMVKQELKEKKEKKQKHRNIYFDEIELALSNSLARKVKITSTKNKGSIQIEFFDIEDLNKIIKHFNEQ